MSEHYPGFAADLEAAVRRTGVGRYRALTDPSNPAFNRRYVEVVRQVAAGTVPRWEADRGPVDGPADAELLANAESCPHRVPMPEAERTPCGCRWKCLAGRGPRRRRGGVLLSDCWACSLAPRRSTQGA